MVEPFRIAPATDPASFWQSLSDPTDHGVSMLITEQGVDAGGLETDPSGRNQAIATPYRRYFDVARDEPAVSALIPLDLSDRHTRLLDKCPREATAPRHHVFYAWDLQLKLGHVCRPDLS